MMSEDEKLVANERTKLLATYVNNLAVGTLVAGFVAYPQADLKYVSAACPIRLEIAASSERPARGLSAAFPPGYPLVMRVGVARVGGIKTLAL